VNISLIRFEDAVLVEIQLYMVIFFNKFFSGSGSLMSASQEHGNNNTGRVYLNNKSHNRYLVKDLLQKRYFSYITGSTSQDLASAIGVTQPLSSRSAEKPLKGSGCSKIAGEVD
jgi:hypothetical protein